MATALQRCRSGWTASEPLGIKPHVEYIDSINQGYGLVELTPSAATVEFRVIDTFAPDPQPSTRAAWEIPAAPVG